MARAEDPKVTRLRQSRTLHPSPGEVRDAIFLANPFFDPRDLLQVRYEIVRRIRVDRQSIKRTAANFGVTPPTVYAAQQRFLQAGLTGLLHLKSGPKGGWKATPEVLRFLSELAETEGPLSYRELAGRVQERFGKTIDSSTIFRALQRAEKKHRPTLSRHPSHRNP